MIGFLVLGLVLGLRHALDADHLAAVGSLASGRTDVKDISRLGLFWGFGHALVLGLGGGSALLLGLVIDEGLASTLELGVGLMLLWLGGQVLWRLWRDRVHFHAHRHGDDTPHFHAHSHRGEGDHAQSDHGHSHAHGFGMRALLVGMMHGMAGSAAVVVLSGGQAPSALAGLAYLLLFGAGSIVGMTALSAVIAVPLNRAARRLTWSYRLLQAAVGVFTLVVGVQVVRETYPGAAAFFS